MSDLDKSKPFGTVWGGDHHGRIVQGGKLFDHDGQELQQAQPEAAAADEGNQEQGSAQGVIAQATAALHTDLMLKAVQLLEQAQAKVVAELEDLPDELLDVVHTIENAAKKRAAVIEAVLGIKAARVEQATKDAQANGLTPAQAGIPADQVSQQLNA